MNAEQRLLKALVRESGPEAARDAEIKHILAEQRVDWAAFKELLGYHELIPLVYLRLKPFSGRLPEDLTEFLRNNAFSTMQRSHYFWQEFMRFLGAFEEADAILVPIKGMGFLADIYSNTFMRPMVDMDLMVPEKDFPRAAEILCALGYQKDLLSLKEEYWRTNSYHVVFSRKADGHPFSVEIHWALDYKRKGRHLLSEAWQRLREIDYEGKKITLLSPEDSLFTLALHTRRLGANLNLKNVYDAILLLHKYGEEIDWDYCLAMCEKYEMHVTLFFLLAQAEFLSGQKIHEKMLKGLRVSGFRKMVIRWYIARNTFFLKKLRRNKDTYAELHFLLHDSIWEPLSYVINIPREQFAKFYGLESYSKKTEFFYRWRLLYILFKSLGVL